MEARLLTIALERETDIILARQRSRRIASLVGFDSQDQTRITTAISEIVRNALEYAGGGRVEYRLTGATRFDTLEIEVRDRGPGIRDLESILAGEHRSATGMGVGIVGARRLMDTFRIQTGDREGATVLLGKRLPPTERDITPARLRDIAEALAKGEDADPLSEVRAQNFELLVQLNELQKRQEQLSALNQELQDTNRGVVALYAELDERADHLRRADELKSRFLSNMTHEFRTPLNSILSLSHLLLSRIDGALTAEQEKQVQFVRKAAENLKELVDDLLDIAKVEAGKTFVVPKEFTIDNLFGALRGMLRPLLVGDAVSLVFEDVPDVLSMHTDEGKISQILRNFISNAIKFTERGEVRVWAQSNGDETVSFFVRDTGIGIAEQDIDAIWNEFSQVPHSLQTKYKGTGLGLPLSKRLAELLKGSVAVQSAPGQGSLFSLTVPRVYPISRADEPDVEWCLDPSRLPVLLIEDNEADAFSSDRTLAYSRYQALVARNLKEAKQALAMFRPVAILLDILLETEETWQFLIDIKQHSESIPVIVVSTTQEERKARELGADEYLHKPIDPPLMVKTLDRLTGNQSVTRVLLVDDEEVSRYLVRQLLPRGTFELKEVATVHDGLVSVGEYRPDIILLDLNMPTVDGFEFLKRLSAAGSGDMPPAVVLSSLVLDRSERERLAGAAGFVSKAELTSDNLVAAIRSAVNVDKGNGAELR